MSGGQRRRRQDRPGSALAGKCADRVMSSFPQALLARLTHISGAGGLNESKVIGKSPAAKRPEVSLATASRPPSVAATRTTAQATTAATWMPMKSTG